jgi:hypothetical protein
VRSGKEGGHAFWTTLAIQSAARPSNLSIGILLLQDFTSLFVREAKVLRRLLYHRSTGLVSIDGKAFRGFVLPAKFQGTSDGTTGMFAHHLRVVSNVAFAKADALSVARDEAGIRCGTLVVEPGWHRYTSIILFWMPGTRARYSKGFFFLFSTLGTRTQSLEWNDAGKAVWRVTSHDANVRVFVLIKGYLDNVRGILRLSFEVILSLKAVRNKRDR